MERLLDVIRVTYPADAVSFLTFIKYIVQIFMKCRFLIFLFFSASNGTWRAADDNIYLSFDRVKSDRSWAGKFIFFKIICIQILNTFSVCLQNLFRQSLRRNTQIEGYINIEDAAYKRWDRRCDREWNEKEWMRSDDVEDYWDLQILFGERIYKEESWEECFL